MTQLYALFSGHFAVRFDTMAILKRMSRCCCCSLIIPPLLHCVSLPLSSFILYLHLRHVYSQSHMTFRSKTSPSVVEGNGFKTALLCTSVDGILLRNFSCHLANCSLSIAYRSISAVYHDIFAA